MTEYYLEIQQNNRVIYRSETFHPIGLSDIILTAGIIGEIIDMPEIKVDYNDNVELIGRE